MNKNDCCFADPGVTNNLHFEKGNGEEVKWTAARDRCEERGYHLAVINNATFVEIQSTLVNRGSKTFIVAPLLPGYKNWPFVVNISPTKIVPDYIRSRLIFPRLP